MLSSRITFKLRCLASQLINTNGFNRYTCRSSSSKSTDLQKAPLHLFEDEETEEEIKAREAEIEKKRNKSELYPEDYNRQHDRIPYENPKIEYHETLLYKRRLYGKYGEMSNVNPSILWPTKKELAAMRDYEEVAEPFTFQELTVKIWEKKALEEEAIRKEEAELLEKVKNVDDEIIDFHKRVASKKQKAAEQLEKKNKLMEKVRKHFGYAMDPMDVRFKELLETFQKEEKKKEKELKKARMNLNNMNLEEGSQGDEKSKEN